MTKEQEILTWMVENDTIQNLTFVHDLTEGTVET